MNDAKAIFQMDSFAISDFKYTSKKGSMTTGSAAPIPDFTGIEQWFVYENNSWHGRMAVDLTITIGTKKRPVCKMSLTHTSSFSMPAKDEDDSREQFLKIFRLNGLSAQISVLRGQLIGITAAIGLTPSYVLPMINVYQLWNKLELSESKRIAED